MIVQERTNDEKDGFGSLESREAASEEEKVGSWNNSQSEREVEELKEELNQMSKKLQES